MQKHYFMIKRFILITTIFLSTISLYASDNTVCNRFYDSQSTVFDNNPYIEVKITDGQLIIFSDSTIARVDVYSAIGGLLYSAKVDFNEVKIDNLPKTFLIIRVKMANEQTKILKIRNS